MEDIPADYLLDIYDFRTNQFFHLNTDIPNSNFLSLVESSPVMHVQVTTREEASDRPLLLKGRNFDLSNGLILTTPGSNEVCMRISERGGANLGTGLVSWDGAVALAKYFEKFPELLSSKRVLELGSGTGIVGIAAHFLGAGSVRLTDLPYAMENLNTNLGLNRLGSETRVSAQILDWKDPRSFPSAEDVDIIVGADIVWLEELVPPLVQTLVSCSEHRTIVYLAHQVLSNLFPLCHDNRQSADPIATHGRATLPAAPANLRGPPRAQRRTATRMVSARDRHIYREEESGRGRSSR
jgi:hypothetical protein